MLLSFAPANRFPIAETGSDTVPAARAEFFKNDLRFINAEINN
jgi:hypothetical protein